MTQSPSIETRIIKKVTQDAFSNEADFLAVEEPLEISISFTESGKRIRKNISVTMRTPGNDEELALGFLFTEGILKDFDQVKNVLSDLLDTNKVIVELRDSEVPQLQTSERNFYTTSSCGVCGKASIDAIKTTSIFSETADFLSVSKETLFSISEKLRDQQDIFESTGGLHASSLFDTSGNFLMLREDVGRHNALDKLIGAAFKTGVLPLYNSILLLSGRASFELIQKAHMAGIRIVAAIGAPSSLAAQLAEECNITLIGFLGKEKFNIYTGSGRISEI
ncbi:formate dehydrogenase accessory sulfurtransferase FdhD [Dyadobacter sp. CY312]|uniref:formate dehydrogenase accessory sulfurtransferase FdhD n=1 Tax=Dyadobacter sp. CY312 TaxID=2907303 RepID=UPI001F40D0C2|nr:formate dehydrogenase accessory sulfurtransferase FdhD [Dyadobacter sp. CY312]MCE7039990.1 formate dehydrogenase accessory sulfurtransferase FdhD [Dyadobacter sp. CY312]